MARSSLRRTRVKICGITSVVDAEMAVVEGADALGLNFYPPSPRYLELDAARAVAACVPAFVSLVALFVNPTEAEVRRVCRALPNLQLLQFHGTESEDFCAGFGLPYIKSIGVHGDLALPQAAAAYPGASALLFDSFDPVRWGGTGRTFDWSMVPDDAEAIFKAPIVLAGGLNPENVTAAIERVRPFAVDVCGGVEAGPGVKDLQKVKDFFRSVERVEAE